MLKKKRPRKVISVFHNISSDKWSNDSNEQFSIAMGSEEYKAYVQKRREAFANGVYKNTRHLDDTVSYDEHMRNIKNKGEELNDAYAVADRKFRRRMSKARHDLKIQDIVDKGLNKHVNIFGGIWALIGLKTRSNQDELYDDGISSDEYEKAVISDYNSDLHRVMNDVPDVDENGDGHIDEDDIVITPGMTVMSKYM